METRGTINNNTKKSNLNGRAVNRIFKEQTVSFGNAQKYSGGFGAYIAKGDPEKRAERRKSSAKALAVRISDNLPKDEEELTAKILFENSSVKITLERNVDNTWQIVKYNKKLGIIPIKNKTIVSFADKNDEKYKLFVQNTSLYAEDKLTLFNSLKVDDNINVGQINDAQNIRDAVVPSATFLFDGSSGTFMHHKDTNNIPNEAVLNALCKELARTKFTDSILRVNGNKSMMNAYTILTQNNKFALNHQITAAEKLQVRELLLTNNQSTSIGERWSLCFSPEKFDKLFENCATPTVKDILDTCYLCFNFGVMGRTFKAALTEELSNINTFDGSVNLCTGSDCVDILSDAIAKLTALHLPHGAVVNVAGFSRGAVIAIGLTRKFPDLSFNCLIIDPVKGPFNNAALESTTIPANVASARVMYSGADRQDVMDASITTLQDARKTKLTVIFYPNDDHYSINSSAQDEICESFLKNEPIQNKIYTEATSEDNDPIHAPNLRLIQQECQRSATS